MIEDLSDKELLLLTGALIFEDTIKIRFLLSFCGNFDF
jgi:hypothetical protein